MNKKVHKTDRDTKARGGEQAALWTVRQSATFLGYAAGTVRNLMAKGTLPRLKLPTGATRIPSEAVRAFAFGRPAKTNGGERK